MSIALPLRRKYTGGVGSSWRNFWWLFRGSLVTAYEHNCLGIAKGAAYSALLSFFPVLTATAAILVQIQAQPVSRVVSGALRQVVPPGTENLVVERFRAGGQRPAALLVAASLISLWAASGVVKSLMEGFRAAYRIAAGRPFLRHQSVAILLVLAAAFPGLAASGFVLFGARVEQRLLGWLGLVPAGAELGGWVLLAGRGLRYTVALGTIVLVTATMYYVGPNRPQRWRLVFPGAMLATGLWLAVMLGFGWYVRHIADYNVLYGSIGAVIALLGWMYVQSLVALIGCEFNAAYEKAQATRG